MPKCPNCGNKILLTDVVPAGDFHCTGCGTKISTGRHWINWIVLTIIVLLIFVLWREIFHTLYLHDINLPTWINFLIVFGVVDFLGIIGLKLTPLLYKYEIEYEETYENG